jgi:hypothetical protein
MQYSLCRSCRCQLAWASSATVSYTSSSTDTSSSALYRRYVCASAQCSRCSVMPLSGNKLPRLAITPYKTGHLMHCLCCNAPISWLQVCSGLIQRLSGPPITVTLPAHPSEQSAVQLDLPLQLAGQEAMPGTLAGSSPHTAHMYGSRSGQHALSALHSAQHSVLKARSL